MQYANGPSTLFSPKCTNTIKGIMLTGIEFNINIPSYV
jgi:hypothetical protein